MKLDTSSCYPKSPLDDDPELNGSAPVQPEPVADNSVVTETEEVTVAFDSADGTPAPEITPLPDNSFFTKLSHVLSWVLVPMLMPVYGVILAFGLSILAFTGFGVRLAFTAVVIAFNVAIPAIIVLLLKRIGIVKDVGLNNREERFIPFLVCILCLVGTAIFMRYKMAPMWLVMFFYGGAAAGVVELVEDFRSCRRCGRNSGTVAPSADGGLLCTGHRGLAHYIGSLGRIAWLRPHMARTAHFDAGAGRVCGGLLRRLLHNHDWCLRRGLLA